MRILKTIKSHQPLSSTGDELNLSAPKSWDELTQDQLRYVLTMLSTFDNHNVITTYMLIRFTGLHIIKNDKYGYECYCKRKWYSKRKYITIQPWTFVSMTGQFKYIDSYEQMNCRLDVVHGLHAVDVKLHGLRFADYLNAEKYYQAFNMQQEDRFINNLALILYRKKNGEMADKIILNRAELLGTFLWFSYVKAEFGKSFPNFFKKVDSDDMEEFSMIDAMNAQIRALTDGDVTKEKEIFDIDCWRALTELDQKAREAEELNRK